jgi:hypothetical protein
MNSLSSWPSVASAQAMRGKVAQLPLGYLQKRGHELDVFVPQLSEGIRRVDQCLRIHRWQLLQGQLHHALDATA